MLVQAQVVPWRGTGRPAELSPSGFHPSRASPTGRRIGGDDYKTEAILQPRADNYTHFREMTKAFLPPATILPVAIFLDRKSTRLNSSHGYISYAVFCL